MSDIQELIFSRPVSDNLLVRDSEALFLELGAETSERAALAQGKSLHSLSKESMKKRATASVVGEQAPRLGRRRHFLPLSLHHHQPTPSQCFFLRGLFSSVPQVGVAAAESAAPFRPAGHQLCRTP